MNSMQPPAIPDVNSSTFVEWRGRTYIGNTSFNDPDRVSLYALPGEVQPDRPPKDLRPGVLGEVDVTDLEAWYSVKWYCTWRGREFVVLSSDGSKLLGELLGADDRWARENGLNVLDRAWVQGTFRVDEVEDLHEERTDLLARWKRRHGG
ncbi:MAG TPA: hypothetical protein VE709_13335 [Pseudonocardiaceae bacterium]|nr:hypothetical protein [Pseudonocardiaceae bacterium]